MKIKVTEWQHEDQMTEDTMYNALYALSKVDIVRLFPKTIEVTENPIEDFINTINKDGLTLEEVCERYPKQVAEAIRSSKISN